eukprot:11691837-Prorocentrum_lima.AAC.1
MQRTDQSRRTDMPGLAGSRPPTVAPCHSHSGLPLDLSSASTPPSRRPTHTHYLRPLHPLHRSPCMR